MEEDARPRPLPGNLTIPDNIEDKGQWMAFHGRAKDAVDDGDITPEQFDDLMEEAADRYVKMSEG